MNNFSLTFLYLMVSFRRYIIKFSIFVFSTLIFSCVQGPANFIKINQDSLQWSVFNQDISSVCLKDGKGSFSAWIQAEKIPPLPIEAGWKNNWQDFQLGLLNPFGETFLGFNISQEKITYIIPKLFNELGMAEDELKKLSENISLLGSKNVRKIICGEVFLADKDTILYINSPKEVNLSLSDSEKSSYLLYSNANIYTEKGTLHVKTKVDLEKKQNKENVNYWNITVQGDVEIGSLFTKKIATLIWKGKKFSNKIQPDELIVNEYKLTFLDFD